MKKIEEIYDAEKLKEINKESYKKIVCFLTKLEKITGNIDFKNAENLEDTDYSEYCKLQNSLIRVIVQTVKEEERAFQYDELERICGNPDFWDEVKEEVLKETDLFLKMGNLRSMGFPVRQEYYQKIFSIIYDEYEDINYACKKLHISNETGILFFRIMSICENCIISRFFSKRRIGKILTDDFGLTEEDISFLWKIFKDNAARLEKIAFSNRLGSIEYRLSKIGSQVDDIEDEVGWITEILFEKDGE